MKLGQRTSGRSHPAGRPEGATGGGGSPALPPSILGPAFAILACLLAFGAIAEVARQPVIPPIDTSTTALLRDLASPGLDVSMRALTRLGDTLVLLVLAGLAVVALSGSGHRAKALFVAVAVAGSLVLNHALKLFFGRPRPAFDWVEPRPDYAFPSGHAMNSFVLYVALALIAWQLWGRRAGILAMVLSLALTVAIGVSRVYLGVHWLSDVAGGTLAGMVWLLVLAAGFPWARRRRSRAGRMTWSGPGPPPPDVPSGHDPPRG